MKSKIHKNNVQIYEKKTPNILWDYSLKFT